MNVQNQGSPVSPMNGIFSAIFPLKLLHELAGLSLGKMAYSSVSK